MKSLVDLAVFLGSLWFLVGGDYARLLYVMAGWFIGCVD